MADIYGINDDRFSAFSLGTLSADGSISGINDAGPGLELDAGDKTDWYQVHVPTPGQLTLSLTASAPVKVSFWRFNGQGVLEEIGAWSLASGFNQVTCDALLAENYFIRIAGNGASADVDFGLTHTSFATSVTIGPWSGTAVEGGSHVFAITRSGDLSGSTTVSWARRSPDGQGVAAGADFAVDSGSVTFAALESVAYVTLTSLADGLYESNESFSVVLTGADNAAIVGSPVAGTIWGDSGSVAAQIGYHSSAIAREGNSLIYRVALGAPTAGGTVSWLLDPRNGIAAGDFAGGTYPSGVLTFAAGQSEAFITIATAADGIAELEESFVVRLTGASGDVVIDSAYGVVDGAILASGDLTPGGTLAAGQVRRGEIALAGEGDSYTVQLVAGRVYQFEVNATEVDYAAGVPLDPFIELRDGAGNVVAMGNSIASTYGARVAYVAPADGTFTVHVRGGSDKSTGNYILQTRVRGVDDLPGDANASVFNGENLNLAGWLEAPAGSTSDADAIGLRLRAGQTYSYWLASPVDASFHADLLDGANAAIANAVTIGEAVTGFGNYALRQITLQVPAGGSDGTYFLRLSGEQAAGNLRSYRLFGGAEGDTTGVSAATDGIFIQAMGAYAMEGGSGTATDYVFAVMRSGAVDAAASVNWLASGVAMGSYAAAASTDFAGAGTVYPGGTVSFAAGESIRFITLGIAGDAASEGDEYFQVTLDSATGGTLLAGLENAVGRIVSGDPTISSGKAVFSASTVDAYKNEGTGANTTHVFRINRTDVTNTAVSVNWQLRNDNVWGSYATANDFVGTTGTAMPSGTVAFAANETSKLVTVTIAADALLENGEGYSFNLWLASTVTNASIESSGATAYAGIRNDDSSRVVVAAMGRLVEGEGAQFRLTRTNGNAAAGVNETFSWRVVTTGIAGSTVSTEDFPGGVLPSGVISFAPGQTVATFSLATVGDFADDDNEAFRIEVYDAAGSLVSLPGYPSATNPVFALSDVVEVGTLSSSFSNMASVSGHFADTGEAFDDYRVHLAENGHLRVNFTSDIVTGSIVPNADIDLQLIRVDESGSEVIAEGDLSLVADNLAGNADYIVRAINRAGGHDYGLNISLLPESDPSVAPTIWLDQNHSLYPVWSHDEDYDPDGAMIVPILRQGGNLSLSSVVSWEVLRNPWGNSASASDFGDGSDSVLPAGSVTFAAGETLALVTLAINNDIAAENWENFRIRLTSTDYGTLAQGVSRDGWWIDSTLWTGIQSSDAGFGSSSRPQATISPVNWQGVHQFEADAGGVTNYVFRVALNNTDPSTNLMASVQWAVDLGDSDAAVTAADFVGGVLPRGQVVFWPGQTEAFVTVQVAGDALPEYAEWFSVRLTGASPSIDIDGSEGWGVILNNDDEFAATTATTAVLAAGGVMVGDIGPAGDKDWIRVNLVAGKSYSFEAHTTDDGDGYYEPTALDPFLVLRDSTGAVVLGMSNDFAGTNGARINYLATASGTYYLEVSGNPARLPTTGEYIVQSRVGGTDDYAANASTTGFLTLDDPVAMGWFESVGDRDWYRVNLRPNESNHLALETSGDVDLTLRLVDLNGNEIVGAVSRESMYYGPGMPAGAWTNASGYVEHAFSINPGSAAAGTYFLEVQGTQAQGYVRSYRFTDGYGEEPSGVSRQPNNVLSVTVADAFRNEGAGNASSPYVFTVHRDGDLSAALAVTAHAVPPPMGSIGIADSADFFGADDLFSGGRQIVFAAGQSTATLTLNIRGDAEAEVDEYFSINVWAQPPAQIGDTVWNSSGYAVTGRIKSDDSTIASTGSVVSVVGPVDFSEGSQGVRPYVFTLRRDGNVSTAESVDWSLYSAPFAGIDFTDLAGSPSIAPSGTVSFAANESLATITVNFNGDMLAENDEYFSLFLSNASAGLTLSSSQVSGRVRDDDTNFISVGQVSGMITEGDSGTSPYLFYVFREGATSQAATVQWNVSRMSTASPLASVAADDFVNGLLPGGTITFAAGQDYAIVTVAVAGDTTIESDEYFQFTLSNASSGWTLGTASQVGRIAGDDSSAGPAASVFSITTTDAFKAEGSGTNSTHVFRINRALSGTGTAGVTSSVQWAVRNDNLRSGTNIADASDFLGGTTLLPSGSVTFSGTETVKYVTLTIAGDSLFEPGEGYSVTISDAVSQAGTVGILASISGETTFAGIYNDDGSPTFAFVGNPLSFEGDDPESPGVPIVIRRTGGNNSLYEAVNWQVVTTTTPGSADANDFMNGGMYAAGPMTATSPTAESLPGGTVAFQPGAEYATIYVRPAIDGMYEGLESFQVQLRRGSGTPLATTTVTLIDGAAPDWNAPEQIRLMPLGGNGDEYDMDRVEGSSIVYSVIRTGGYGNLNSSHVVEWEVDADDYGSIATAADFGGGFPAGRLTFAATTATVQMLTFTVTIANDTVAESEEWFSVELFSVPDYVNNFDYVWRGWQSVDIVDNDDEFASTAATASRLGILGNTFGGFQSATDDDWFKVSLAAGQTYQFVIGTDAFALAPTLRLLNSAGAAVAGASIETLENGGVQVLRYTPSASGDFFLSARSGTGQVGEYALWTGVGGQDDASDLMVGAHSLAVVNETERMGMIDRDGDIDWYRLDLRTDSAYEFEVGHFASLQLDFSLYDANGDWVTSFTNYGAEGLMAWREGAYTPITDGTYYLKVAETGVGLGAGGYVLDVWDYDFYEVLSTEYYNPVLEIPEIRNRIVVGVDAVAGNIIEGGSGTTNQAVFRVVREGFTGEVTTRVAWAVQTTGIAGDAIDAADFVGGTSVLPGGVITFAPGQIERYVTLLIAGDANANENESFRFQLLDAENVVSAAQIPFDYDLPVSADILASADAAEVVVHDLVPEYSIALESQYAWPDRMEGASWVFRVSRSGRIDQAGTATYTLQGQPVVRDWMTFGTAASNDDIVGAIRPGVAADGTLNFSGAVSFAAGETLRLVTITSMPDGRREDNEGFRVTLSTNDSGGIVTSGPLDIGIWNDDLVDDFAGQSRDTAYHLGTLGANATLGPRSDYVGDANSATTDPVDYWRFTAGASGALSLTLTGAGGGTFALGADIDVRLEDRNGNYLGSSTWGGNASEAINFGGLIAGQDYYVSVYSYYGSSQYELSLSSRSAPTALSVSALDAYKVEGNAGTTAYTFVVNRSGLTPGGQIANWSIAHDSTDAADFFGATTGTLTFAAGATAQVVTISVNGDAAVETLESFRLAIASGDADVLVTQGQATGYIANDDIADSGGDTAATATSLGALAGGTALAPVFGQVGDNDDIDWYSFTADADGVANVRLSGMSSDADLFFYDSATTQIAASTFGGAMADEVAVNVLAGQTYYVKVDRWSGNTSYTLDIAHLASARQYAIAAASAVRQENAGGATTAFTFEVTRGAGGPAGSVGWRVDTPSLAYGQAGAADFAGGVLPTGFVSFAAGQTAALVTVSVVADGDALEGDETFAVSLFAPVGAGLDPLATTATGTILAGETPDGGANTRAQADFNFAAGNFGFAQATGTLSNGGTLSLSDAVALGGDSNDYYKFVAATSGTVTLDLDGLSADADVQVLNASGGYLAGGFAAGNSAESVSFDVFAGQAYYVRVYPYAGSTAYNLSLSLSEDATPDVWIEVGAGGAVRDEGGSHEFIVHRSTGSGALSVSYSVAAAVGTEPNADDFGGVYPGGLVNFADGAFSATITIASNPDANVELDEAFRVTLAQDGANAISLLSGRETAVGVIRNDDVNTTTYAISAAAEQVEGQAGPTIYAFTVTRSGNLSTAGEAVWSVPASTVVGAANAADFGGALPSGTLSFSAGQATATINVSVSGDGLFETDEFFSVNLASVRNTGASVVPAASISVGSAGSRILNDDAPMMFSISMDPPAAAVDEGSPLTFTVSRSGDLTGTATVGLGITHLSTTATDLSGVLPTTISFAAGVSSLTLTVNTVNDILVENDESFRLNLLSPSSGYLIDAAGAFAYGAISASDQSGGGGIFTGTPTIGVASSQSEVGEGTQPAAGGELVFTLRRSGNLDVASTVAFRLTGTATTAILGSVDNADLVSVSSADSAGLSGILLNTPSAVTFGVGQSVSYLTVSVAADSLFEQDEQFKLELLAAGSSNIVVPTTGTSVTATLRNDDAPPLLSITAPGAGLVNEGSSGTAALPGSTPFVFTVTRDQETSRASTVAWAVQAPAAMLTSDFVGATAGTVTFNAFQTETFVTVNVKADSLVEDDEAFSVVLSAPTNALLGSNPSAAVTIVNDDVLPTFSIAAAVAGQAEGNSGTSAFVYTISRSGNAQIASSVRWSVADDGDANLNFADFGATATAFPGGVLNFAAGEVTKTITVAVAGDTLATESDERFRVLLAPVSNAQIGTGVVVSNIYDDDHIALDIAPNPATLVESASVDDRSPFTPFVFTLTRSGLSPDANVTSVFNWSVVTTGILPSLAADAEDFLGNVMPAGTITFGQGVQVQTITINVQNDLLVEGTEAFRLAVTQAAGTTGVDMGGVKNGTLVANASIEDDDELMAAEFSITALAADLQEGNTGTTAFTFRVTRTGNLALAASLGYMVDSVADSSVSYADFGTGAFGDLPYGRVTFAAGQTSQVVTVAVRGDTWSNEGDEWFSVSLTTPVSNLSGGASSLVVIGSVDTAYGVIRDDDLSNPDYAGGMAYFDGLEYGFVIDPRDLGEIGPVARVISGDRIGGLLADGETDEQDVYRFRLAGPGSLNLTLGGMTVNTDADLYLYGWEDANADDWIDENELTLVAQSFNAGNVNDVVTLPYVTAGDYVALVESYSGSTPYTLSLASTPIADGAGNTLALAKAITALNAQTQSFTDFVGGADGNDYYKFTTSTNTYFSLALSGLSADADVRLLNTSGQIVAAGLNAGSASEAIDIDGLGAGTYYVWVAPYDGASTFYNLSLSAETLEAAASAYNTRSSARTVTLSATAQVINDSVGRIDAQDYYKFTLTAPTRVELGLSGILAGADVDVELLDAAGNRIASGATAGNASESIIANGLAAGEYYARVYSVTGASNYALSLKGTAVPRLDAGGNIGAPVTLGVLGDTLVTRSDYVGDDDRADLFRFSVGAGARRLAVELTGMSGDLDVTILDANFNDIDGAYYVPADAGKTDGPADEIFDVLLGQDPDGELNPLLALQPGDYYVLISQGSSAIDSSNYQLSLSMQDATDADDGFEADTRGIPENGGYDITPLLSTAATPQRVVIPEPGQSTSYTDFVGSLDPHDYYRFTLDGPRNLRLTMNGMTANADVELLNADGAIVASSRKTGSQAESISVDNLAAGDYYVHVLRGTNNVNTRYSLNMTALAPTDTAGNSRTSTAPAPKLLTLSGTPAAVTEYVGSRDEMDYYKFTLATAGSYTVSAALGNIVGSGSTTVRLLEADGTTDRISRIAGDDAVGGVFTVTGNTAGATYFIEVMRGSETDELSYQLNAWAIGNSTVDGAGRLETTAPGFSTIDDSFTAGALNATATGPKAVTLTTLTQTFRDVVSYANDTSYDDDWYKVVLGNVTTGAGGRIVANLSGLVGDASLTLYQKTSDTTFTEIASSDFDGTLNEAIVSGNLAAGTYYLRVATADAITGYALDLKQVAVDDYVASIEAMQMGGSVGVIALSGTDADKSGSLAGRIELAGDADWFKVHLTAGTYNFTARGTAPTATAPVLDTRILGIYNASGSLLADSQGDDSIRTTTTGTTTTSAYTTDAQVTLAIAEEGDYYISAAAYGSLTGTYTMLVSSRNEAPVVANPIGNQTAAEGSPFVLRLPWNVFRDPEGRPLTITATLRDGSALPSWLTYDESAQMFTGVVPVGAGDYQIRLRATDPGFDNDASTTADNKFVDTTFTLTTPRVTDDFAATVATTGTVTVGGTRRGRIESTYDVDWIKVSLEAGQAYTINLRGVPGSGRLSDPMIAGVYDAAGVLVQGTQNDDFGASLDSRVTFEARDAGSYFIAVTGAATSIGAYEVAVSQSTGMSGNVAPEYHAGLLPDYVDAIEGGAFNYVIPSGAFTDEQSLTYSAKLSSGEALPSWLAFNATTRTFNATAVPTNINDLDIRITATDTYGLSTSQDMVLRTKSPTEVPGTWTIMVYMAADNDLEQYALKDLNEMESVTLSNGVRLVVMVDRHAGYSTADGNWTDTRRGLIRQDNNLSSVTSLTSANSVGELDTGSPNTLTDFINWSASNYRAQNYGLVIWDHGGGLSGTSWDFTTSGRSNLSVAETTNAIATSILGRVDMLGFDTCLQGMVEQVVDVSSVSDYTVASSDLEPGDGWDYARWLSTFTASATPTDTQVATAAVTAYGTAYQNSQTLSAVDSARLGTLVDRINDFVSATDALGAESTAWDDLLAARTADGVRNYNSNDYIDLGAYMDVVAADVDLGQYLRDAASAVSLALDAAVIAQTQVPDASGLSVFLPGTDAAANAADYNSSNFKFLADSRWATYVQNLAANT